MSAKVNRAWAAAKGGVVDARTVGPTRIAAIVNALHLLDGYAVVSAAAGDAHIEGLWNRRGDADLHVVEIRMDVVDHAAVAEGVPAPIEEQAGLRRALRILRAARDEGEPYDYRWEIYLEACSRISVMIGANASTDPPAAPFPADLTPDLAEVLGKPNFWCGPIASAFRVAGEAEIPHKAEAEQAFVLHWLTTLVLQHGASWRKIANDKIEDLAQACRAAPPSDHVGAK
ncbi:MAG: hypothetical protein J0H94_03730 [Rhizobiales bacterium]|nr:hypothetical protein [Hyphomicrobiales bacterium]